MKKFYEEYRVKDPYSVRNALRKNTPEKQSDNIYDIEFHNVSLKYPCSDVYAKKNLSFKFRVGENVAHK